MSSDRPARFGSRNGGGMALRAAQPQVPLSDQQPKDGVVIWTKGLTKRFAKEAAVDQLTFQVPRGRIVGLIGPSGCGKTTTVRLLTGVYRPTAGEANVLGSDPLHFSKRIKRRIGYMPQQFVLYPDLSILENLYFASSIYGISPARNRRIGELLEFVELLPHRRKTVRHISGGMQRRLSLLAALVHDPELLFLDEPTAGIDPVLRRKLWEYFQALRDQGRTLLVTTQYVGEAAYCDLVAVMEHGTLRMVDTPESLRRRAFGGDVIELRTRASLTREEMEELRHLRYVYAIRQVGLRELRITTDEASTATPQLVHWCQQHQVEIESIQEYLPPFDDVFVELLK